MSHTLHRAGKSRKPNRSQQHLLDFIRDLLIAGAETGGLRSDVPPEELAHYSLYALTAANGLPSKEAVAGVIVVAALAVAPSDPNRVVFVTQTGALYRSDDAGATWRSPQ